MNRISNWLVGGALALAACNGGDGGDTVLDLSQRPAADMAVTPPDYAGIDFAGQEVDLTMVTPMTIDVTDDIQSDTTWAAPHTYVLKKHIFVEGATLTIQPGVTIKGGVGTSIVITNTAKIDAVGTAQAPIVLTSGAAKRAPGDWGGLVLLGKAPINVAGGTAQIEGFPNMETRTVYGGMDPTHDCGKVKYVRIEFAGYELAPDNELNGLSTGACGSKTEIDYVQVHKGADDGVEMFGGTANLKHIFVSQPDDDGLDWDYGWQGKVQFLVVQQNASVGNYGMECDGNGKAHEAMPWSMPTIYNATLQGSNAEPGQAGKLQAAMLLRRGTAGQMYNFIVEHFADYPIDVADAATVTRTPATLFMKSSILFDNANVTDATWPAEPADNDGAFDESGYFNGEASNRKVDPMLNDPMSLSAPNFLPKSMSPALTGGATPPDDGFFDKTATFVGAFGQTDWAAGWTAFPAE